jgi:hypothetical protein
MRENDLKKSFYFVKKTNSIWEARVFKNLRIRGDIFSLYFYIYA